MRQRIVQKALHDAEAIRSTIKSEDGVAFDFNAESRDLGTGDVGEIGDDEIETAGDLFKEIAAQKFDVGAEA